MATSKLATKKRRQQITSLSEDSLRKMLNEASRDDKAEAQRRMLGELRPVLFELMANKGWSSRKTAHFLKVGNINTKAKDIDRYLEEMPLGKADMTALETLKARQHPTGECK